MKKIISLVLVTLLVFAMPISAMAESDSSTDVTEPVIWDGSIGESFLSGSGTEAEPFIITTGEELAYLAYGVNDGLSTEGFYFELGADIYLNDVSVANRQDSANVWAPIGIMTSIGDVSHAFKGNFDGKGHKIVGLYVTGLNGAGLFGSIDNATVENIVLEDAFVKGDVFAGGIAAWHNSGTISGCAVYGEIIGAEFGGGIVGANCGDIKGCINYAKVSGGTLAGGVASAVDMQRAPATITQCINYGDISADTAGGILGGVSDFNDAVISECFNAGSVSGTSVGGIIGSTMTYESSPYSILVTNCANNGEINVLEDGIGAGIVCDYQDGVAVENCWNSGTAVLSQNAFFAGIAAKAQDTAALASVDDSTDGTTSEPAPVPSFESCYYLDTTAENGSLGFDTEPDGIYAVSGEDASEQVTFDGFDFEIVWGIADGEPVLRFAHKHNFDKFATDEEYHYPLCECGEIGEGEEHTLGEWEIVFDATCEDEGMTGRKCSGCNTYVETEVIDAYGCLRGDINNDGKIDADDYILLKRIYFGTAKMEELDLPQTAIYRCDVNIDSLVNADDYICLKRAYFGNYTIG